MYSMTQPIALKGSTPTTYGAPAFGFNSLTYPGLPSEQARNPGDGYTQAQRTHALAVYAETGNEYEVERQTGIPRSTVQNWVNDESTPGLVAELRNTIRYNEGWRLARMVSKVLGKMDAAIDLGDAIVNKAGQITGYKPPPLKDLTITMSILMDKWMLISGALGNDAMLAGQMDKLGAQLSEMGSVLSRLSPPTPTNGSPLEVDRGENLIG